MAYMFDNDPPGLRTLLKHAAGYLVAGVVVAYLVDAPGRLENLGIVLSLPLIYMFYQVLYWGGRGVLRRERVAAVTARINRGWAAAVCALVMSTGMFLWSADDIRDHQILATRGVPTHGDVVSVDPRYINRVAVSFDDRDGRPHRVTVPDASADWSTGDRVTVEYDPTDPGRARLAGGKDLIYRAVFTGSFGFFFGPLWLLVFLVAWFRDRRKMVASRGH